VTDRTLLALAVVIWASVAVTVVVWARMRHREARDLHI
jgi:hypothetical protein